MPFIERKTNNNNNKDNNIQRIRPTNRYEDNELKQRRSDESKTSTGTTESLPSYRETTN